MSWLGRLFGRDDRRPDARRDPRVEAAVRRSAEIYAAIPLHEIIDEQRRSKLARELFLQVNALCLATDPVTSCREQFVAAVLELATYQVLVIPPPPEADESGLRALPGISGALRAHLPQIAEKNDDLRSTLYEEAGDIEAGTLWPVVQRLYWEAFWRMQTVNAVRIEIGDRVEGDDWDIPFLHAACVNAEHVYRWNLEMPSAFDGAAAREAPTAYSMFLDIVLSGAQDPAAEWRDYHRDCPIPMPRFEG